MILVTLGTQDKAFPRLLEAIEKQLKKGTINDEVIVQAGCTAFESEQMKLMFSVPSMLTDLAHSPLQPFEIFA